MYWLIQILIQFVQRANACVPLLRGRDGYVLL